MKIAFVGKGGAGKTAVSSLFVRSLTARREAVVDRGQPTSFVGCPHRHCTIIRAT